MNQKQFRTELRGLLSKDYPWPCWEEKEWEAFASFCSDLQLEGLLFFRLRETPSSCSQNVFERLKNRYELSFAHFGRLKAEVDCVSKKLCDQRINFGFLKGYPLALHTYPHPACRKMQDVDLMVNFESLADLRDIFKELGYSALPDQSKLEKKPQFVKLHGNHVFAFEFHRTLHTSYREKIICLPENAFDQNGFPNSETLFLSVLLHHKFMESGIRDLFDLHFLTRNKPNLDWRWIEYFCQAESLMAHLHQTANLANLFLGSEWPNYLKQNTSSKNGLIFRVKKKALFWKKKRGLWEKFCDAALGLFVYDHFFVGVLVFCNKYVRHVKLLKYFKMGFGNS